METKFISRVNNVDIVAANDAENFVPIKPICEALGIDANGQKQRIERDEILGSTACMIHAVASDGKDREMYAIPFRFVFGWLFSIDASKVREDAQEVVIKYKMECYNALYEYFTEPQTFLKQKQVMIEEKVSDYQSRQRDFKDAQKRMYVAKTQLNEVLKVTIDDWRANNKQMELNFKEE